MDSHKEKRKKRGGFYFKGASEGRFEIRQVWDLWGTAGQDLRSRLVPLCSLRIAIGQRTLIYKQRLPIAQHRPVFS